MRKLLVASQKGGVGKTTTSINLAAASALAGARVLLLDADPLSSINTSLNLTEHPNRQSLRTIGIDLPGVLVSNVMPGLDVLSPYEDGGCSDDALDRLLSLLVEPACREFYSTLIVDTPPFLGTNPRQILSTSTEFVIVMRAEPLAYRTLPAFLELVQRSKGQSDIKMRGILLTLPEGEEPGGRWERELRGRFGTRILPLVVPYDEPAAQAGLFGQIVSQASPESPVSRSYAALVENLALAVETRASSDQTGAAALLLASAALKNNAARRATVVKPAATTPDVPRELPTPEPVEPPQIFVPSRRRCTPVNPIPAAPPARTLTPTPAPPPEVAPAPVAASAAPEKAGGFQMSLGAFWVSLAIILGVGLRFLKLPDYMVPVLVGVGVGAVVVVVARYLLLQEENSSKTQQVASPARPPSGTHGRPSGVHRRLKPPTRKVNEN